MHHSRVQSLTSEDQDPDHDYSDESSNEASSPKRRKVSASWVNVSCQLCKTRKVKCDRTLPSCGWCTRNNAVCEYKERKKPGLRAGYGRELEQRLDRLEGVLLRHEQMLTRALGGMNSKSIELSHPDERSWRQPSSTTSTTSPYTFSPREPEFKTYSSSQSRIDSTTVPYPNGQHHRDFIQSLPPITTTTTHDRRPSVTFMNNPASPTPHRVKLSASQSTPQVPHIILKHSSTSAQPHYPPLPTPDTASNSNSDSPRHVEDYLTHKAPASESNSAQQAEELRRRYPLNIMLKDRVDEVLPPWQVMYELAISYFVHINSVLPLISESTVFDFIAHPQGQQIDGKAILMAITIVAMRLLPTEHLSTNEQEYYTRKCREALASPTIQKTKDGTQALAILLLNCNEKTEEEETTTVLRQVNERLWQGESAERKPQSPLSVNEMLCRP